jgi:hypothetical protein
MHHVNEDRIFEFKLKVSITKSLKICIFQYGVGKVVPDITTSHCSVVRDITNGYCNVVRDITTSYCYVVRDITTSYCNVMRAITTTYCSVVCDIIY